MIHYALPTTADLLELGAPRADALSIYLTTDPTPAGRDLAFTTAKSAVDEAIRALRAAPWLISITAFRCVSHSPAALVRLTRKRSRLRW